MREIPKAGDGERTLDLRNEVVLMTEDKDFAIERKACLLSSLLRDMLMDTEVPEGEDVTEETQIPLLNVDSSALPRIGEYLERHVGREVQILTRPLHAPLPDVLDEWEKDFVYFKLLPREQPEENWDLLYKVTLAADFLGIEPLRDLCCATIANMINKKKPEEIKKIFGVTEDITPAHIEEVVAKYPFLTAPAAN
eukprot:TRINITY_DN68010_c8_g1_i2.p1 TRINITY_DN68010_c8_g1~~TRINITY_DN68010_c8_g1_i2.p1  ORF type:complete len:195 (-),score=16.36 TRINITY_DN68010_c8_g1_i2:284-868(-)